jgi:DNA-binding transcriptional MerR regulator
VESDKKKIYYSISEVCALTGLESHVLRYWETEFPQLRPKKNSAGNRAYRQKDIDIVRYIKFLLYEELYTIPGARKKCAEIKDDLQQFKLSLDMPTPKSDFAFIKKQLREILAVLSEKN